VCRPRRPLLFVLLTTVTTTDLSDLDELSVQQLEEEVATLAADIYAGTCRWLELVGELDRRGSWDESGCGSCAEWLAWRCALLPRAAREHVRVARCLPEVPPIHSAFARGELSYAKVRALTRVANADSEEELLKLARFMTAAQLERAVRAYRRVTTAQAEDVHADAHLVYSWDDDGALIVRARLAPEDGALFLRALEHARDQLNERGCGSAEPSRRPTNADAVAAMADVALVSAHDRSGGDRYQVLVHVDAEALAEDDADSAALDNGPRSPAETARRLACDASVVAMTERSGKPLRAGRKTRTIPPPLRRALTSRDRGCRFPGCENHRFVDAHHIRHWARGGETSLGNLVLLCRRHHRLLHEGGYSIDDRLRFHDRWGQHIRTQPGDPETLCKYTSAGPVAGGDGDPMDLDLAVDAFVAAIDWPSALAAATL
jgi:Domain of unknown function (DUF222)/HNH endonuclease